MLYQLKKMSLKYLMRLLIYHFSEEQTLFEIKHQGEMIDLTNNETFMDYLHIRII